MHTTYIFIQANVHTYAHTHRQRDIQKGVHACLPAHMHVISQITSISMDKKWPDYIEGNSVNSSMYVSVEAV